MAPKRKFQEISEEQSGSSGSKAGGNTRPQPKKKRCSPAKKWVFTNHRFQQYDILAFKLRLQENCVMFSYQEEECPETKKRHLQGFCVFKTKVRPISVFRDIDDTIHWETMRGTVEQNIHYTSKGYTRVNGGTSAAFGLPRAIDKVTWEELSIQNQNFIKPIMEADYDYRTIHWVYDSKGNWGKSLVQKYLVDNFNALMVAGGGKDIAFAIKKYYEEKDHWPDYVLCNIPKSTKEEYISYGMFEQVKDGLVFSGKYESCMLRFPKVKLIVFANVPPAEHQWSDDRVQLTVI